MKYDTSRSSSPIAPFQGAYCFDEKPGAAHSLAPGYYLAAPLALKSC